MKKILIATTALVATAGVAAAEVSLNGYGRFGLDYNGAAPAGISKTQVNMRFRLNFNASVETDSGVTFGGRVRLQYTDGGQTTLNAGMLFATYEGLRLEVGNANTAYDSAALLYAPEIGYLDRSFGDPSGAFFGYASTPRAQNDYMGIFVSYSTGDLNVRFSYADPNQTLTGVAEPQEEIGISADYKFGAFQVSAAYVADGAGIIDNDQFFIGAAYDVNDQINVGINFIDNGDINGAAAGDLGETVALYGSYTTGAIKVKGYVARNSAFKGIAGTSQTTFGIGADYDLGGARLSGDIHRSNTKDTVAGIGVRFDF